jgi:hypothetical protein
MRNPICNRLQEIINCNLACTALLAQLRDYLKRKTKTLSPSDGSQRETVVKLDSIHVLGAVSGIYRKIAPGSACDGIIGLIPAVAFD